MPEFEYRGYRIRTLYEKNWQVRIWPPLTPPRLADKVRATRAEGEDACRSRARAVVDAVLARQHGRIGEGAFEPGR